MATKVKRDFATTREISWRAILAGLITVLSLMLILNLFGLAAGFGSIEPTEETDPLNGLGTGAIVWWGLSNLLALAVGGYVAARVGVTLSEKGGILQGLLTWSIYAIVSAWLLTTAVGKVVSGLGTAVGSVLGGTGELVKDSFGPIIEDQVEGLNISLEDAKEEFYALLEDTNKEDLDPNTLQSRARQLGSEAEEAGEEAARRPSNADAGIDKIFRSGKNIFEQSFEELDRDALVNIVVERTDMSQAEAQQTVDEYLAQYENLRQEFEEIKEEAKQKVNETAEKVAEAAAEASLYLAIALILGAMAAAFGGYLGIQDLRTDHESGHYVVDSTTERNDNRNL